MRTVAKRLLPPVLVDLLLSLRQWGQPREWEYLPEGWPAQGVRGWNTASVVRRQLANWPRFRALVETSGPLGVWHETTVPTNRLFLAHNLVMSFGYVLARAAHGRRRLTVLDWGGGIGHYYALARALLPEVQLDYAIRDVPQLCVGGRAVLPEVQFFTSDDEALSRPYDLIMASGSLHYAHDWRSLTARFAQAASAFVYVNRLPLVRRAPTFAVVQRPLTLYQTEYVGWFWNRHEFLSHFATLPLTLIREFLDEERVSPYGAPEQAEFGGFLFQRQPYSNS